MKECAIYQNRIELLEKKNPFLTFLLCTFTKECTGQLEQMEFAIQEDAEVILIEGVGEGFKELDSFLENKGRVIFIEKDLSKIALFLKTSNLIEQEGVFIVSTSDEELRRVAWSCLYSKKQMIGKLAEVQRWLDGVHLTASDFMQNKRVVKNLQTNLLHSHEFINGYQLKDAYKGQVAIICGSGPSLNEQALAHIRNAEGGSLVIAAGSAMSKLDRAGIRIDFGVYVDPNPELTMYQKISKFDFPLFYQNRMCEQLFTLHKGKKIWMGLSSGWHLDELLMKVAGIEPWELDSGWNAGTFALSIAAFLGCQKIIFVGLDHGELQTRALNEGEFVIDGMITRRDLSEARHWIGEFVKKHPQIAFMMPNQGLFIDQVTRSSEWYHAIEKKPVVSLDFKTQSLNFSKLAQWIGEFHSGALIEALESFFSSLKEGVDSVRFQKEKILLEVELGESLLVESVLKELWEVFAPLYEKEAGKDEIATSHQEVSQLIAQATFYLSVARDIICPETYLLTDLSEGICFSGNLEGQVKRKYPSGALCAIEYYRRGKRHGKWLRMFESGDVKAEVFYREGVLHGPFTLWGERGIKREGAYWLGKKDGCHRLFYSDKTLLAEMHFNKGVSVGEHDTYYPNGQLKEKILYQTEKKFNRYCYNDEGDMTYRGVFKNEVFEQEHLEGGRIVSKRCGRWINEELVWD